MTVDPRDACPVCGAATGNARPYDSFDDRYGYPGTFHRHRCANCSHRFIQEIFNDSELQNQYTHYYPRSSFDLEHYLPYEKGNAFTTWLNGDLYSPFRWVKPGKRVLDIGCGFGQSLGYLQQLSCDVYGVEADENIRRVADKFGFKVHAGLFDPANYANDFFDVVTMGQVIEHVANPRQTLLGVARVLKPGGIVILSTPNAKGWGAAIFGKYWINWHAPYHLQLFTPKSMQELAEQTGLQLDDIKTITPSEWLHSQWLHLLTYPDLGAPSVFWSPGGNWSLGRRLVRFILRVIHQLKINHLVTRLFDVFGVGDNKVYFLRRK